MVAKSPKASDRKANAPAASARVESGRAANDPAVSQREPGSPRAAAWSEYNPEGKQGKEQSGKAHNESGAEGAAAGHAAEKNKNSQPSGAEGAAAGAARCQSEFAASLRCRRRSRRGRCREPQCTEGVGRSRCGGRSGRCQSQQSSILGRTGRSRRSCGRQPQRAAILGRKAQRPELPSPTTTRPPHRAPRAPPPDTPP